MPFTILIAKETRAGETRVALIPAHVNELIKQGHTVFVEHLAGVNAGFTDQDYITAGAQIRSVNSDTLDSYKKLFEGITHIVRVKRPDRSREMLENKSIAKNTVMIGALDPLEQHSPHLKEYQDAGIDTHSIDQLSLPPDHPMNILSSMSKIAGRLALADAINHFKNEIRKIVIIGFGTVGQSAFYEAIKRHLPVTVMLRDAKHTAEVTRAGGRAVLIDNNIRDEVVDADIVITSARRNNEPAPLLITDEILQLMRPGSVIVDMALSEGGNVSGSQHDATLTLGNNVIVTNVSGYPKAEPTLASELWSQASLLYLQEQLHPIFRR